MLDLDFGSENSDFGFGYPDRPGHIFKLLNLKGTYFQREISFSLGV